MKIPTLTVLVAALISTLEPAHAAKFRVAESASSPFLMLAMRGEELGLALGIVGLVTFIALVGVWGHRSRKRIAAAWAEIAARHKLEHAPDTRHVRGTIDGGRTYAMFQDLARNIFGEPYRSQYQRLAALVVRVELASQAPERMLITKKPLIGSTDVPTGDEAFDEKMCVQCADKEAAHVWLASAGRRAAIMKAVLEHKMTILGPMSDAVTHDGVSAPMTQLIRRSDWGYKPRVDWFEERFQEFTQLAREIDEADLPSRQPGVGVAF